MTKPLDDLDFSHLFGPAPPPEPDPDPFGRIGAGNPDWESVRGAWMDGAPLGALFGNRLFDLNESVGAGRTNQRGDVFKLQALLHREGASDATATGGPTGYWGGSDDLALRSFQKENGLAIDGWAAPGGETMTQLQALYRPLGQALQVSDAEMEARHTALTMARDLAGQLGLEARDIDFSDPAVLPALGGVAFIRYSKGREREAALQKVQALRASDPKLAGKLQALAAEIASQPQWHYDKMTPEELQRARQALDEGNATLSRIEKRVRPYLRGVPKLVDKYYVRPAQKIIVDDERRRLDGELDRRRDPRDR